MRKLLIPTLAFCVYAIPALAQDAPKQSVSKDEPKQTQTQGAPQQAEPQKQTQDAPKQDKAPAPTAAQNEDDALVKGTRAIERSVQTRLGLAGYTDIQMLPTSFLVRAKDPDGNPVMLVLGPESMTDSNDAVPDRGSGDGDSSHRGTDCGQAGAPCPGADEE